MSLLRSMTSVNFRVNEDGETTFFFPVFWGVWCPRKGYRITSDNDVATLKRFLRIYLGIVLSLVALVVVVVVGFMELQTDSRFLLFLIGCAILGVMHTLIFERVFLRNIVAKYETTNERPRFKELQRLQAENQTRNSLVISGLSHLFFFLMGLFAVLSGIAVAPGIVLIVIFSLGGAQVAYQLVLRRQGK